MTAAQTGTRTDPAPAGASWYLRVTYADFSGNRFLNLGGAGWPTMAERDAEFARIPDAPDPGDDDDSSFVLDVLEPDGFTHSDDKTISRETAQLLLGRPIDELIAQAAEAEDRE